SERTQQLINYFEPSLTLIGLQRNSVDSMNQIHMQLHKDRFINDNGVQFFETDAYSMDHGQSTIEAAVADLRMTHNVILKSLGPKLSAVALYRMHLADPSPSLAYAPSKEFSKDYSSGIGATLGGKL